MNVEESYTKICSQVSKTGVTIIIVLLFVGYAFLEFNIQKFENLQTEIGLFDAKRHFSKLVSRQKAVQLRHPFVICSIMQSPDEYFTPESFRTIQFDYNRPNLIGIKAEWTVNVSDGGESCIFYYEEYRNKYKNTVRIAEQRAQKLKNVLESVVPALLHHEMIDPPLLDALLEREISRIVPRNLQLVSRHLRRSVQRLITLLELQTHSSRYTIASWVIRKEWPTLRLRYYGFQRAYFGSESKSSDSARRLVEIKSVNNYASLLPEFPDEPELAKMANNIGEQLIPAGARKLYSSLPFVSIKIATEYLVASSAIIFLLFYAMFFAFVKQWKSLERNILHRDRFPVFPRLLSPFDPMQNTSSISNFVIQRGIWILFLSAPLALLSIGIVFRYDLIHSNYVEYLFSLFTNGRAEGISLVIDTFTLFGLAIFLKMNSEIIEGESSGDFRISIVSVGILVINFVLLVLLSIPLVEYLVRQLFQTTHEFSVSSVAFVFIIYLSLWMYFSLFRRPFSSLPAMALTSILVNSTVILTIISGGIEGLGSLSKR